MAAIELFPVNGDQPFYSARRAFAITPGSSELSYITKGLFVGGAGDVEVQMADGSTVTFTGVLAGTVLPIMVKKVTDNTTATNIVGLA